MRHRFTLLVLAVLVSAAVAEEEKKHTLVAGTDVELILPAGFVPDPRVKGYQHPTRRSMIMVDLLPGTVEDYRVGTTKESLERMGGKLLSTENVKSDYGDAFLAKTRRTAQGQDFHKWLFYLGDDRGVFRVSGVYPIGKEKEMSPILKAAVLSARRSGAAKKVDVKVPEFTCKPEKPLKLAKKEKNGRHTYTEHGRYPPPPTYLLFIVAPSYSTQKVADRKKYALERIKDIPGVKNVTVGKSKKLKIDRLEAWEVLATATREGKRQKLCLFETIVYGEEQYFIMIGIADEDRTKEALKIFRKTAKSFRRKKGK